MLLGADQESCNLSTISDTSRLYAAPGTTDLPDGAVIHLVAYEYETVLGYQAAPSVRDEQFEALDPVRFTGAGKVPAPIEVELRRDD